MKKTILLILISLFFMNAFAVSTKDYKAFTQWVLDPKTNFNVIDYVLKNNQPDLNFPSITTKTAQNDFKIIVLKKKPLPYSLKIYSYDLNKTIDFNKQLILETSKFDIYKIIIPYEYKNLRFQCDYQIRTCNVFNYCITNNFEDNSTDDFSVKPYKIFTIDKRTNVFHILVDNGKSLYYDKGTNKNYYSYFFIKGKGLVDFWLTTTTEYYFCLNNNWTIVDADDTSISNRQMPCFKLLLPPIKTGWGGIDTKTGRKFQPVDVNSSKNIYIKKIMW